MTYQELKAIRTKLAEDIRVKKSQRKGAPHGVVPGLNRDRYEARHHHIAYCLLRGRTIDEIEKPADDNTHSEYYVEQIMKSVTFPEKKEVIHEAA